MLRASFSRAASPTQKTRYLMYPMNLPLVVALTTCFIPSFVRSATVLSYWNFDNSSIANPGESGGRVLRAVDGVGPLADGNIEGNTTTGVSGRYGEAFSFDGNGDKLYLFQRGSWANNPKSDGTNGAIASQTLNNFSVSVWANPTTINGNDIIYGNTYNGGNGWDLRLVNGAVTMEARNGTTVVLNSTATLATGEWSHIVVNYNNGLAEFFVNGVAAGSDTVAASGGAFTTLAGSTTNLQISRDGTESFHGSIDELWLFSGTLGIQEIANLQSFNAIPEPSVMALGGLAMAGFAFARRRK